ncbi:MAG TPA: hypothetical protein VMA98_06690 [Candidatus Acidoferrales bacterium]|nr:hypothetical protein [Candidatus Acidoferrales bacterium]
MRPMLATFIRLTIFIAIAIVLVALAGWLLHIVVIAAVIAALAVGGLFLYNVIRRRSGVPVIRR